MKSHQSSTFTCFPQLPIEPRLKIWRHAQPTRFLEISLHEFTRFSTHFAPPTILSINRESRAEALKSYKVFELDKYWGLDPKGNHTITFKFIFNQELDTIYVSTRSCVHVLHEDVNRVFDRIRDLGLRSLAVEDGIIYKVDKFCWKLLRLDELEELVVVVPYGDNPGQTELLEPAVQGRGVPFRASKMEFRQELMRCMWEWKCKHPERRLPVVKVIQFSSYPPQRDPFCYSAHLAQGKASEPQVSSNEENTAAVASYPKQMYR